MTDDPNAEIGLDVPVLQRVVQPGLEHVQGEIDPAIERSVRDVSDRMTGEPADDVYDELISRLRHDLAALNIHEEHVHAVAHLIEDDVLKPRLQSSWVRGSWRPRRLPPIPPDNRPS